MPPLRIDLREGFSNDSVSVEANGKQVFHKDSVTTNYSVGLAECIPVEMPAGRLTIRVVIASRNLQSSIDTEIDCPLYVAIAVSEDGSIGFEASSQEPTYL